MSCPFNEWLNECFNECWAGWIFAKNLWNDNEWWMNRFILSNESIFTSIIHIYANSVLNTSKNRKKNTYNVIDCGLWCLKYELILGIKDIFRSYRAYDSFIMITNDLQLKHIIVILWLPEVENCNHQSIDQAEEDEVWVVAVVVEVPRKVVDPVAVDVELNIVVVVVVDDAVFVGAYHQAVGGLLMLTLRSSDP